jgi:hypothetical protein
MTDRKFNPIIDFYGLPCLQFAADAMDKSLDDADVQAGHLAAEWRQHLGRLVFGGESGEVTIGTRTLAW